MKKQNIISRPEHGAPEHGSPPAETFLLRDDGKFPNSRFPLVIFRDAIPLSGEDPAAIIEQRFAAGDWTNSWRDGIYAYHHYHSIAHEVLGVFSGTARVQFGGDSGVIQDISAGDVIVIPAGVAHKKLESSADFNIVGAYAGGRDWDIQRGRPGERPSTDENIRQVPLPRADPVFGPNGPLLSLWK